MNHPGYANLKRDKEHKSEYKSVYRFLSRKGGEELWQARFYSPNGSNGKMYETEREAAKAVDMFLISKGKEPVNILKRQ